MQFCLIQFTNLGSDSPSVKTQKHPQAIRVIYQKALELATKILLHHRTCVILVLQPLREVMSSLPKLKGFYSR